MGFSRVLQLLNEEQREDYFYQLSYVIKAISDKYKMGLKINHDLKLPERYSTEYWQISDYLLEKIFTVFRDVFNGNVEGHYGSYLEQDGTDVFSKYIGVDLKQFFIDVQKKKIYNFLFELLENKEHYMTEKQYQCNNLLKEKITSINIRGEAIYRIDPIIKDFAKTKIGFTSQIVTDRLMYDIIDGNQPADIQGCIEILFQVYKRSVQDSIPDGETLRGEYLKKLKAIMQDSTCSDLLEPENIKWGNFTITAKNIFSGNDLQIINPSAIDSLCYLNTDIRKCFRDNFVPTLIKYLEEFMDLYDKDYENRQSISGLLNAKDLPGLIKKLIDHIKEYGFYNDQENYYPWIVYHQGDLLELLNVIKIIRRSGHEEEIEEIESIVINTQTGYLKSQERKILEDLRTAISCTVGFRKDKEADKRFKINKTVSFTSRIRWKDMTPKQLHILDDLRINAKLEVEDCQGEFDLKKNLQIIEQLPWSNDSLLKTMRKLAR